MRIDLQTGMGNGNFAIFRLRLLCGVVTVVQFRRDNVHPLQGTDCMY